MNKNLAFKAISFFLISLFVLFSAGADFFHDHSGSDFHDNCPACLWLLIVNAFVFFCILVCLVTPLKNPHPVVHEKTPAFISKYYLIIQYLRSPPLQSF